LIPGKLDPNANAKAENRGGNSFRKNVDFTVEMKRKEFYFDRGACKRPEGFSRIFTFLPA